MVASGGGRQAASPSQTVFCPFVLLRATLDSEIFTAIGTEQTLAVDLRCCRWTSLIFAGFSGNPRNNSGFSRTCAGQDLCHRRDRRWRAATLRRGRLNEYAFRNAPLHGKFLRIYRKSIPHSFCFPVYNQLALHAPQRFLPTPEPSSFDHESRKRRERTSSGSNSLPSSCFLTE